MQTHFEKELSDLKQTLLVMASYAETAVRQAVDALLARDNDLALAVNQNDDLIDRLEKQVDETAITLLSKAPLASDLRLISVAMKISQNLERVGDEASKIAKRARELTREPALDQVQQIPPLAELSLALLRRSLDTFVKNDSAAARALIPEDKQVDVLNKNIHRELVAQMTAHPLTIERSLALIVIAKSLERIADHAKNIAEETVYLCEAQDIRHTLKAQA